MRVYVDSSALIKRSVTEPESDALDAKLDGYLADAAALVSSSLAWVEVSRAIRLRLDSERETTVNDAIGIALSGIAERPMAADVVALARRIGPMPLRSLDALHLATAVLLDVDLMICYDERLADAARQSGLGVDMPG